MTFASYTQCSVLSAQCSHIPHSHLTEHVLTLYAYKIIIFFRCRDGSRIIHPKEHALPKDEEREEEEEEADG